MDVTRRFYWRNTRLTSPLWAHRQVSLARSLNTTGKHFCQLPTYSLLQIFPSLLRPLTTANLANYYGQIGDINNHLFRKVIDILLCLRKFLGGWDMMSRWQGVWEETSLRLPRWKRLIIALVIELAGNGLSGMNSNAALSGFNSWMLLTLAKTVGSLSSLWAIFNLWSSLRKFESGSHFCHGAANWDGSLDDGGPTRLEKGLTSIFNVPVCSIQSTRGDVLCIWTSSVLMAINLNRTGSGWWIYHAGTTVWSLIEICVCSEYLSVSSSSIKNQVGLPDSYNTRRWN